MLICWRFWSWKPTWATRMWMRRAPFILKCFEQRWHWNLVISLELLDWAAASLLGVKLCTRLKCKLSRFSSTNTKPQISQRKHSSEGFSGDDSFATFTRLCFGFVSFFGFEGGGGCGASFALSSGGNECPNKWIVNLSSPRRTSLQNGRGHLIGLLFTLIRFNLNVSMFGNSDRQHRGHDNSEHIFERASVLIQSRGAHLTDRILIKFDLVGTANLFSFVFCKVKNWGRKWENFLSHCVFREMKRAML